MSTEQLEKFQDEVEIPEGVTITQKKHMLFKYVSFWTSRTRICTNFFGEASFQAHSPFPGGEGAGERKGKRGWGGSNQAEESI